MREFPGLHPEAHYYSYRARSASTCAIEILTPAVTSIVPLV